MATVTPLTQPEGPKPSEIQIEIQNVIDARRKLQNLIAGLNKQQAEAELAFLREFSRDLAALKVDFDRPFVDGVFNKYSSVKQMEDQITQRATALGEITTKIEKRINELKQNNREDLMLILKRDLEKLMLARTAQEKEGDLLDKEIDRLKKEISQLEGTEQEKVPQSQTETAPQPPKGNEAIYEMNIAPRLKGSWFSFLKRIKHRVSNRAFRKWEALLCGKDLEEQLWAVPPPKHGLTHPVIREWALQTLQMAGYDTSVMLAEWELFWRRKGL